MLDPCNYGATGGTPVILASGSVGADHYDKLTDLTEGKLEDLFQ